MRVDMPSIVRVEVLEAMADIEYALEMFHKHFCF